MSDSLQPLGPQPSRRSLLVAVPVAALGTALWGCASSDSGSSGSGGQPGGAGTTTAGGAAQDSVGNQWPMFGRDYAQTRTNVAETKITKDNLNKLAKAWEITDLVGVSGTPLVIDGIAYFADWKGQVWAVKADTGTKVWSTPIGGMIPGSPAVDGDGVFVAGGNVLYRLNRKTGAQEWKATTNETPQAQISSSPVVVDGIVLQGTASFENMMKKEEYAFRGSIGGYDAATGKQKWNFFTTPIDASSGAGAGIWSTPAVDTKRGLLYVGTGQGLSEPTPPMANSILAIDYRTGTKKWSTQFTHPDVFSAGNPKGKDYDVGTSPNLFTVDGTDVVGAGDKAGSYHVCDRDTGKVLWSAELTPGSAFGGVQGAAAIVDGVVVVPSNVGDPASNAPTNVAKVFGLDPKTGAKKWTSEELTGKVFAPVSAIPGVAFCGTDEGRFLALDPATGKTLWSMDGPAKTGCGPSIVDGRILWGYGFILFGAPGPGGVLALEVKG